MLHPGASCARNTVDRMAQGLPLILCHWRQWPVPPTLADLSAGVTFALRGLLWIIIFFFLLEILFILNSMLCMTIFLYPKVSLALEIFLPTCFPLSLLFSVTLKNESVSPDFLKWWHYFPHPVADAPQPLPLKQYPRFQQHIPSCLLLSYTHTGISWKV